MTEDKNFFRDMRKKFLGDLLVKQSKELKKLHEMFDQGTLKDSTELYKMKNKVRDTEEALRVLTSAEQSEPVA